MATTTTQTTDTPTLFKCDCPGCPRMVKEGEARVCRRALRGRVVCCICRIREYPDFEPLDQPPPGCSHRLGCTGYGEWTATLTVRDGREFIAGGRTDQIALSNARFQARQAGAL